MTTDILNVIAAIAELLDNAVDEVYFTVMLIILLYYVLRGGNRSSVFHV